MKKLSLRELKTTETHHEDIWSWAQVQRRISKYFTYMFLCIGVNANTVTMLNLIISLVAARLMFSGLYLPSFLLYQFYFILDCSDGEVARYRNEASDKGLFLDRLVHIVSEPLLFLSASFSAGSMAHGVIPAICCENGLRLVYWCWEVSTHTTVSDAKQGTLEKFARFFAVYGFTWLLLACFLVSSGLVVALLTIWSVWTPLACVFVAYRLVNKRE